MTTLSPSEMTDTQLVQCIIDGDHQAFQTLFERYRLMVYRYCALMLNDEDGAEDIYQESFLALYEKCVAGEFINNVQGFLLTVARRRCLNSIRNNKSSVSLAEGHLTQQVINADFDQFDTDAHIRKALAELPIQYREAFVFFEIEGYSYEEISEYLNVSFNVVRNRIYRAKKILQEILEPIWSKRDRKKTE